MQVGASYASGPTDVTYELSGFNHISNIYLNIRLVRVTAEYSPSVID
jgi:hypothetical protein